MKKILVLEDEANIRSFVVINLNRAGYETIEAGSGEEALEQLRLNPDVGVALLDIMLPDMDGFEVCRRIRAGNSKIGIIMLTARTQEMDKVTGFMTGADDYVTKPFRPRELVARVKARLRRRQAAPQASSTLLSAGAIEVDLRTHLATLHGEPLLLTPKEFAILAILAQSVGSPVSAADLFEGAWHERFDDAAANTVMVHIRRLRKKLADIDASTTFIETAWGVGYKLRGAPGDTGHGA